MAIDATISSEWVIRRCNRLTGTPSSNMKIFIKRAYEDAAAADGYRALVDRAPPRLAEPATALAGLSSPCRRAALSELIERGRG